MSPWEKLLACLHGDDWCATMHPLRPRRKLSSDAPADGQQLINGTGHGGTQQGAEPGAHGGSGVNAAVAVLLPELAQLEWLQYLEVLRMFFSLGSSKGIPAEWGKWGAFPRLEG